MKRFLPHLAILLTAPAPTLARAQDDTAAIIARVESPQKPDHQGLDGFTILELMHRFHVPGVSIAVVRDFKLDWAKAYGVADVETDRPVETITTFQAASISKPVTAMAAMRLVEDGRFKLDDSINTILKSWHAPDTVTPRSLMSHLWRRRRFRFPRLRSQAALAYACSDSGWKAPIERRTRAFRPAAFSGL